jgi:CDP-glycerol glycerophosphotransferase
MSRIMWMLSALLPKWNTAAVHTWPSYDDTALALIPELEKSRLDKIYYLAAADIVAGSAPTWGSKVVVLPKRSLRAAWAFLTSRWVFWTHQCYTSWFPHRVESVNLWHGMLIKKLGWMSAKQVNLQHSKYDLATSEFWEPFVRQCMRPWGKVLVNGLPRYDRFRSLEPAEVRRRLGGVVPDCRKLVTWMPTYRQTVRGDPEADGKDFRNDAQMPGFDPERFNDWLAAHQMVCILKPHPLGAPPQIRTTGHLLVMDDATLVAHGLTLYELLGGTDILITDISSVYIDFLILNRPIVHAFADREEYGTSRGFLFDWNEEYFAGPFVSDMNGIQRALEEIADGRDEYIAQRSRLRSLFHANPEQPATPALLAQVGLTRE